MKEKLIAMVAVLLALCVIIPAVSAEEPQPVEEYETSAMLSVFLFGAVIGIGLKIMFDELTSSPKTDDTAELCREFEADYISGIINTNLSTAASYSNTISDLVPFSREHFIRQGELAAAYLWSPSLEYNVQEVLEKASVRDNLTNLQTNVFEGFSSILNMIEDRTSLWNRIDVYKENMNVSYIYGSSEFSSSEILSGCYLPVAKAYAGSNVVYLCSQEIWTDNDASIVREDGYVMQLREGYNNLGSDFRSGVYTLQNNRIYASYMLPALASSSAPVFTGLVMSSGDTSKIAYLESQEYVIDNVAYDGITIKVETKEGYAASMNVSKPLAVLDAFYKEMSKIQTSVSSSAAALWDIYDTAGEANAYISTLSVPNFYEDIELSETEKEIITILALEQLAEYYKNNEEIKNKEYKISKDSLRLYCEGSIKDPLGNTLAEDVIFTPFFYGSNTALFSHQANKTAQNGIAAIWARDSALTAWDGNTNEASLLNISNGCILDIKRMVYNDLDVNSISLKTAEIDLTVFPDYNDDMTAPPVPSDETKLSWIVKIVCITAGLVIIFAGPYYQRYNAAVIGVAVLLVGIAVAVWERLL